VDGEAQHDKINGRRSIPDLTPFGFASQTNETFLFSGVDVVVILWDKQLRAVDGIIGHLPLGIRSRTSPRCSTEQTSGCGLSSVPPPTPPFSSSRHSTRDPQQYAPPRKPWDWSVVFFLILRLPLLSNDWSVGPISLSVSARPGKSSSEKHREMLVE
jgi:hypothetical protein